MEFGNTPPGKYGVWFIETVLPAKVGLLRSVQRAANAAVVPSIHTAELSSRVSAKAIVFDVPSVTSRNAVLTARKHHPVGRDDAGEAQYGASPKTA